MNNYCNNWLVYSRRKTNNVKIGNTIIGGESEICLQTMTNTLTSDIEGTVNQIISSYKAGSNIVRITVPSMRDIDHLKEISQSINQKGYKIPLVADIHFNQKIAFEAAKIVDKVRINPGNFADTKSFKKIDFSAEEYNIELTRIKNEFVPLLDICKQYNTALRIGTNHGSLSDRIMSKYGDTPEGMVESAMEFVRICKEQDFSNVLISMKSSNTLVMVQATRLLASKMKSERINYPLHLGVTEAGEGEDGRIKSALGIGTLLSDGIGETIRVSLTEPPEFEIPVAKKLVDFISERNNHSDIENFGVYPIDPYKFSRRKTNEVLIIGGNNVPVIIGTKIKNPELTPDIIASENLLTGNVELKYSESNISSAKYCILNKLDSLLDSADVKFYKLWTEEVNENFCSKIIEKQNLVLILESSNKNAFADLRAAIFRLINNGIKHPVIIKKDYSEKNLEDFQIKAASDLGGLLIDGLIDGIWLTNKGIIDNDSIVSCAFGILQASRMRVTKPEYISCPSCGRTLFNLQHTTKLIRKKTAHLKGLKIGIMGCIVNGLGEMADADYGYIGSGPGKINLYFNKELIKRGIDENHAVDELIKLIKEKGDWIEP